MTDALSYQACAAVVTLLQQITITNGFRTDIGSNVSLEDDYDPDAKTAQAWVGEFSISEGEGNKRVRLSSLDIAIEVVVPAAIASAWQTAHNARQDILDCLPDSASVMPIGVGGLKLQSRKIIRRPDGAPCVVVQVVVRTSLTETVPVP